VILVKGLRIDPVLVHSISMITLLVLVQTMVGRREAFYWYNGAVHYLVMHSFAAFFLARLISAIITSDDKKNRRKLFMTSILGILVGGGNYMTALLLGIILSLIFFYFFYQKIIFRQKPICSQKLNYQKKWQQYIYLLIPVIFFLTAFVINIVAPGNRVRSDGASGMNPIKSIMVSFHYVLEYALSEWTGWVVILMVVTLIPLFWKAAGQTTYKFSNPLIIVVISLGLLAATITPPLYAMGNIGAGRLQALIYTVYILLLVLNTGYLTGWLRKRFYDREDQTVKTRQWSPATAKTLFWGGVFLVFGVVLSVIPDPHYFTSSSAFTDLSNGRAAIYRLALTERADQLNRAKEGEELILEPLPEAPRLLLTEDISADKDNWLNRAMAEYYRVKTVGME
jgi:hypothetical protein